jgi:hypothetical protein
LHNGRHHRIACQAPADRPDFIVGVLLHFVNEAPELSIPLIGTTKLGLVTRSEPSVPLDSQRSGILSAEFNAIAPLSSAYCFNAT